MRRILLVVLTLLICLQLFAGSVIGAKELAKLQKQEDVVIVSARSSSDYASKHISGAVNVYHQDLYRTEGVEAMLKPAAEIAAYLGEKGISENSKIVIYDDGENKLAGRLYWILNYLGAENVMILDGHIKSWMKARLPVTSKATAVEPVVFTPKLNESIYADMEYVKSNKDRDSVILLDVRSADEYAGRDEDEKLNRKGYIPGAINLEYKQVLNEDGTMKSREEIKAVMAGAGVSRDKEIIIYCATSVRAGIVYMALKSMLDYPQVRVYDGAFYEWESGSANPVN
jgi:thiosulfate/3-mercaptopyruvate sulfurtransferase